jgi:hypothetical protein
MGTEWSIGTCEWCKKEVLVKTLTIDTGPEGMCTGYADVTICKECFINRFGRDCESSWDKIELPTYLQFTMQKQKERELRKEIQK